MFIGFHPQDTDSNNTSRQSFINKKHLTIPLISLEAMYSIDIQGYQWYRM